MELAKEVAGTAGMLVGSGPGGAVAESNRDLDGGGTDDRPFADVSPIWHFGYTFAPALTLGGGTFAVQRNIIAERVLGLPRDHDADRGRTWAEARAG